MKLAELQAAFQQSILAGEDHILAHIPDSPRETKTTLFGVYRNAYVIRLTDFLKNDFQRLHAYLGDEKFERLALEFIAAHPSHTPNARWYGQELPEYVSNYAPFAELPMVAALAKLEGALNDCFDCLDAPALSRDDLAAFAPEEFEQLVFDPHPSARRFDTALNLDAVWTALAHEEAPPAPDAAVEPHAFLVWRHDLAPKYRVLSREEAMMWDEASKGVRFGVLCELLATFDDPDTAAVRAAQHLQTWIVLGLLSGVQYSEPRRT